MNAVKSHFPLITIICAISFACYLKDVQMDKIHAELQAKCVDVKTGQWKCE